MKNQVIIAHPGKQHSFHTARALKKSGMLYKYITSIYYKNNFINNLFKKIPAYRAKMNTRVMNDVEDSTVQQYCQFTALIGVFIHNAPWFNRCWSAWNDYLNNRFERKVGKYVRINNDVSAVISYDNNSRLLFKITKAKVPDVIRILDVSSANFLYMKSIYEEDMKLSPDFAPKLYEERKILWNEKRMLKAKEEIELSQYFLVGSSFVKKSLVFSGVDEGRIYICPYGVDVDQFSFSQKTLKKNEPLQFIFVGGTKQLKGISYLLEAFLGIPESVARLTVVGINNLPQNLLERYKGSVRFTGQVPHDKVADELCKADIMVFPSLGEGFSLSVVEALSVGLPVIGTTNIGVNDYIRDSYNGFVIPIQDKAAIMDKVLWFHHHRDKIPEMSRNARNTALSLTWDAYYENVAKAVKDIIERETVNA